MLNIKVGPIIRQYLIVIVANLSVLNVGLGLAWPSPVLVKLRNETETILPEIISEEDGSWVVSIGILFGPLANFLGAYLVDRIGRKGCIILSYVPRLLACFILTFATEVWMLMVGRMASGMADCMVFCVVPMYALEIASKEVRGSLGTILQIFSSIGIVTMLSMGPFTPYIPLNIVLICVAITTLIPTLFVPDSPYYLHSKGRKEETLKVLIYLRGSETLAHDEIKEYAANEARGTVDGKALLRNKAFLKALAMVILIGIGSQAVGFNAVSFYLQTILESTQTTVNPQIASVIIGMIQLTASICTTLVSDRFGRKPILTSTLAVMSIGMVGLGVFFKLKESGPVVGFLNYLPIISLVLVVFSYSAGVGSLIWSLNAELFDGPARAIGVTVSLLSSMSVVFLTTKYFALLNKVLGPAVTYWFFSINALLMCMFIMFCVPETKDKTIMEIQAALGANKIHAESKEKCEKC